MTGARATLAVPKRATAGWVPAGLATWVAALALLPAPLAARILLLAPLVVVPRLLTVLPARPWIGGLGGWPTLVAATPLLAAFALPPGPMAAALTVPWLGVALAGLAAAVRHGLADIRDLLRPARVPDLGVDVALGFLAVGAIFLTLERLGADVGFSAVIVLLTATHFHLAGFGLLAIASLLAAGRPWLRASILGLGIGIPLTALGFVVPSETLGAIGALVVGSAGIGVGLALLTTPLRRGTDWALRAAGVALLIGMPMGIAWSVALVADLSFLDIDTMVRTHGALNATAVMLAAMTVRSAR